MSRLLSKAQCFLAIASALFAATCKAVVPTDCASGRSDNTCAAPVNAPNNTVPDPPPNGNSSTKLAGVPSSGYSYWGYDFQRSDADQVWPPMFVNRSGRAFEITLLFTIPGQPCLNDCLPGVEFYAGSTHIYKIDPTPIVSGNTARTTLHLQPGDAFAWIIGLWRSTNPLVSVTADDSNAMSFDEAGISPHPELSELISGKVLTCTCNDGSTAQCKLGDHYTNGLSGDWSQKVGWGGLSTWTNCQKGGT